LKSLSLPSPNTIRERIKKVNREDIRTCLMTTYLCAARISEVVAIKYQSDKGTTARGPKGIDTTKDVFITGSKHVPCAIFTLKTAKRGGKERKIALPLNPKYEPWTKQIYDYFQSKDKEPVFPFTRQEAWLHSKSAFEGLTYPIEFYFVKDGEVKKKIDDHIRDFRLHALRHLRATELREQYQFDGFDLASYCGWHLATIVPQISRTMERYLSLGWSSYFPKLLKRR
jgi:integrase